MKKDNAKEKLLNFNIIRNNNILNIIEKKKEYFIKVEDKPVKIIQESKYLDDKYINIRENKDGYFLSYDKKDISNIQKILCGEKIEDDIVLQINENI